MRCSGDSAAPPPSVRSQVVKQELARRSARGQASYTRSVRSRDKQGGLLNNRRETVPFGVHIGDRLLPEPGDNAVPQGLTPTPMSAAEAFAIVERIDAVEAVAEIVASAPPVPETRCRRIAQILSGNRAREAA